MDVSVLLVRKPGLVHCIYVPGVFLHNFDVWHTHLFLQLYRAKLVVLVDLSDHVAFFAAFFSPPV